VRLGPPVLGSSSRADVSSTSPSGSVADSMFASSVTPASFVLVASSVVAASTPSSSSYWLSVASLLSSELSAALILMQFWICVVVTSPKLAY
jgi:hypothetical protein